MNLYHVDYSNAALKELKKLDPAMARMIVSWVRKNLENCDNPRIHGKALTANLVGQWRYRVGDYRLLAHIHDQTVTILILSIGHRSEVYTKH